MNIKISTRILIATALMTLLPACGSSGRSTNSASSTPPVAPSMEVIVHTVQSGDRLSDIAKQYTGSAENWRNIAAFNEISNPRRLRVGAVIEIPMAMAPGYVDNRVSANRNVDPARSRPIVTEPEDDIAEVVIKPVDDNRSFELKPLPTDQSQRASTANAYIKVVGSYYPKGVYSQPAPYSTLLLRVAPGTLWHLV